jgi:hypothetical protein
LFFGHNLMEARGSTGWGRVVHVEFADAFAVAFGLDGGAKLFAHGGHAGDGAQHDSGRGGVGAHQCQIAETQQAQEKGLFQDVILDAVELNFLQPAREDSAVDLEPLRREFVNRGPGRPPADQPQTKRNDQGGSGKSARERNARQRRGEVRLRATTVVASAVSLILATGGLSGAALRCLFRDRPAMEPNKSQGGVGF